jgi:hypothetical protein
MNPRVREDCTAYALDDNSAIDPTVYEYVKEIMSDVDSSGVRREEIVMHYLGYVHNTHKHGYDGTDGTQFVEHKGETEQGVEEQKPLAGKITYGSVKTLDHLNEIKVNNPKITLSGWTREGRLVYIIECLFNDTGYYDKIKSKLNTTTAPKATWCQLPTQFDVKFLSSTYSHTITGNFLARIKANQNSLLKNLFEDAA